MASTATDMDLLSIRWLLIRNIMKDTNSWQEKDVSRRWLTTRSGCLLAPIGALSVLVCLYWSTGNFWDFHSASQPQPNCYAKNSFQRCVSFLLTQSNKSARNWPKKKKQHPIWDQLWIATAPRTSVVALPIISSTNFQMQLRGLPILHWSITHWWQCEHFLCFFAQCRLGR